MLCNKLKTLQAYHKQQGQICAYLFIAFLIFNILTLYMIPPRGCTYDNERLWHYLSDRGLIVYEKGISG